MSSLVNTGLIYYANSFQHAMWAQLILGMRTTYTTAALKNQLVACDFCNEMFSGGLWPKANLVICVSAALAPTNFFSLDTLFSEISSSNLSHKFFRFVHLSCVENCVPFVLGLSDPV